MKKDYMKPEMRVAMLLHEHHLLVGSGSKSVQSIQSSDGFTKKSDGFSDDDFDM